MNPVLPNTNTRNNRNNKNRNKNNNRDFSNKLSNFGQKLSNAAKDVNQKVQQAMNNKLSKYDLQVNIDPDIKQATDNPNVLGYYIPLNQFKNLITKALKGE